MADRRRYIGTRTLQIGWTVLLAAVVIFLRTGLFGPDATVFVLVGTSVVWPVGLIVLGLRERRRWNRLVEAADFDPCPSGHPADLQTIRHGQSVTVTTGVTGLFSPERTTVRANVEGVDASFTVRIVDAELADADGLETGDETLDERFVITGAEGNVAAILTGTIRDALRSVTTPGTYTITAESVVYEVPFTDLKPDELDAAGDAVALTAARLEAVGGS